VLGEHPIEVVLLATDLDAAAEFYADRVGLVVHRRGEDAVTFKCGGETRLTVTRSTTGTADEQTQAAWWVDDLASELRELRERGVRIEEYDTPELKTVDGVADIGFAFAAWIIDPGGNCLGILQLK
jgi:catechol-2,3-dioxygenase